MYKLEIEKMKYIKSINKRKQHIQQIQKALHWPNLHLSYQWNLRSEHYEAKPNQQTKQTGF